MDRPLTEMDWIHYEIADKLCQFGTDPDDRPFQSKYEARETWSRLRSRLLSFMDNAEKDISTDSAIFESALATLSYEIARNYASTEERPTAETWAKESLQRLNSIKKGDEPRKEFVSVEIALRNALGCIYCERSDPDAATVCLREAERIYLDFKSTPDKSAIPWSLTRSIRWICGVLENIDDRYSIHDEDSDAFEQLHTYTLYYLAQAYKQAGELGLSAKYCQETLVRQLKSGNYDPIEWAINTATLSVYYVEKCTAKSFFRARRCIAAADVILGKLKSDPSSERLPRAVADVDRCWAKYGLALLDESRERLSISEASQKEAVDDSSFDIPVQDDFPAYLPDITKKEQEITCDFVKNFAEARDVFLKIQRRITNAQSSFYTLYDHATDHTELVQDYSRGFKALIFFESDIDRKCKMHKRRIDLLNAVYKELNPSHYLAIRRQISFELGEIYYDMLDLKMEVADEKNKGHPNVHQIAKINMLARSGIQYFQEFLQSFEKTDNPSERSGDQSQPTSKYDPADVRPIILAHFYCARLVSKILTSDMKEKLINCDASLREYRWIVDYVDRVDPDALERVKGEYDICKDMVSLLPMKMDRMKVAADI